MNTTQKETQKEIQTTSLSIELSGHVSKSYLAYPASDSDSASDSVAKPIPGVLVIPEFWGLTEVTKNRANQLAKDGYCALALDVYGEGYIAPTAKLATEKMNQLFSDMKTTSERLKNYWLHLKSLKVVDEAKTASIGYCLGGALSLHLARMGVNVTAVVSFHGKLDLLDSIHKASGIKAQVLVCHGEEDTMVSGQSVQNFKQTMDSAGVDYRFVSYPNAQHGWTNPQATERGKKFNIPISYNEVADKASYKEMLKFFKQVF